MLKLLNILSLNFETYLIILNEKAHKDENLLNLNTLIIRLKQEEHRMQTQEKQINALHYYIGSRNSREDCKSCTRCKEDKNVENEHDDNDSSDNKFDNFCLRCYINHRLLAYKYCLDKDVICSNDKCKKRDHQFKNCRQKDDNIHKKKNSKKNKSEKSNKTFKTFIRYIASVKIFINDLIINHCDFYILNLKTTHHCSGNKALFKNLRTTHEVVKTANDELLKIKTISNIEISFSNGEFLVLSEVIYISTLIMNLIVISQLWHKGFDVLYSIDQSCKICLSSGQLMTNANIVNNQWILKTIDFIVINAMTTTAITTSIISVKKTYIFAFAKLITDVKIWHRCLIHVNYKNILINAKKIIDMKNVIDLISETVCESCMTDRLQQKQLYVFITKVIEFI